MSSTILSVKLDGAAYNKLKDAAQHLNRTPQFLVKQAIVHYLEQIETDDFNTSFHNIEHPDYASEQSLELVTTEEQSQYQPFSIFSETILAQTTLRSKITLAYRLPEPEIVPNLLEQARVSVEENNQISQLAYTLAEKLRNQKSTFGKSGIVQNLLQEFSLSSQEGIALMCLAEALLRIPDNQTRDKLIRDKISTGNWDSHLGKSTSLFVNAATWGLVVTGKLVSTRNEQHLSNSLNKIVTKGGEPLIRKAVDMAMRLMGEQFVTGKTITEALNHARKYENQGFRYSYDMLGEAALTEPDAQKYLLSYQQAIHAIGKAANGKGIYEGPGISIKISALHPRYTRNQYDKVMNEVYPRLLSLTLLAKHYDIGLNIDAEEADRLELSLDLLEKLCFEPQLAKWNGIGFVVQAYQKRCPLVIDYLIDLAKRSDRRLMIRLVKGAYWDSEIKRAQVDGLEGYPVYTRKMYTDVSYLACARKLLAVPKLIYPQFATHNAHTVAAIYHFAGANYYPGQYEFQCLHGMGEPLYIQVVGAIADGKLQRPCRIYAPVGSHETLLAYLVRRLLENGANTSFVNKIADKTLPLDELIQDPVALTEIMAKQEKVLGLPHPKIPLPHDLYGKKRANSKGFDLSNEQHLASFAHLLLSANATEWEAKPLFVGEVDPVRNKIAVVNPANFQDIVGYVEEASTNEVAQALAFSQEAFTIWSHTSPNERVAILQRAANLMEDQQQLLISLLVREAGKTFSNAIAEVREAVDFLRYYSLQVQLNFSNNTHHPLGCIVCISPWNFPLAIFIGQISAALAVGNSVIAKPAEQTPLIAYQAIKILYDAGLPQGVVQLLPGNGETVGVQLIASDEVKGVMFTGSTQVATSINRSLTHRLHEHDNLVPLIAETGGLNAMIVDSSALTEQVVIDVITSAFDSAGQRCSALRILCLQDEIADHTLEMLKGAIQQYIVGNPDRLSTDIGPVIDLDAKQRIEQHIQFMRTKGKSVYQASPTNEVAIDELDNGYFIKPTIIELDKFEELEQEIFGPVLHIVRYKHNELQQIIDKINQSGYGLTLGVHTRIDETVNQVVNDANVGNIYVNRNIVGAVVGVQPFGGEGLSGTGPKAGGPLYLYQLLKSYPVLKLPKLLSTQYNAENHSVVSKIKDGISFSDLMKWLKHHYSDLTHSCEKFTLANELKFPCLLDGPTGEKNTYTLHPRKKILCITDNTTDLLIQLAAVLAVGSNAIWCKEDVQYELYKKLPNTVQQKIHFIQSIEHNPDSFDLVLLHGDKRILLETSQLVANKSKAIVPIKCYSSGQYDIHLAQLFVEHAVSINTAAAGGNTSLMTLT